MSFKISNGSTIIIKQYECKNYSLFPNRKFFHLNNTSFSVINKKIININPTEKLGVYIVFYLKKYC